EHPPSSGWATLAFVFDVTGSMYDDLVQVMDGASRILERTLSRSTKPISNYVLVPFHDPEVGPITLTTDPRLFQRRLRELHVQGGGDCPEMSVGAIRMAVEVSYPGSFVYVFSDARAKDYEQQEELLQLLQHKQTQVVFVLTGDCGDRSHPGYRVYERIATTSSGQIFHLDKQQVTEVLKWVEEAIQASKVHLLSTDHEDGGQHTWPVPFDPSLKEVTVSLSGPAPGIEVRDPAGKILEKGQGLKELLSIPNSAMVVAVEPHEPGTWSVTTQSSGRHSLRITGISSINFQASFSTQPDFDASQPGERPVQGLPISVLVNCSGLKPPGHLQEVELFNTSGHALLSLPMWPLSNTSSGQLWVASPLYVPPGEFLLKVKGADAEGHPLHRLSGVTYTSVVAGLPKVNISSKIQAYNHEPQLISCSAWSEVPFRLQLSRGRTKLGEEHLFWNVGNISWLIPAVSKSDEGFYECTAKSKVGVTRARAYVSVSEPPPRLIAPANITASPGQDVVLSCLVLGDVPYNLTWSWDGKVTQLGDGRTRLLQNRSLEISHVQLGDGGQYECTAQSAHGTATASLWLFIEEAPWVMIDASPQRFGRGQELRLNCTARGHPPPRTTWKRWGWALEQGERVFTDAHGTLHIRAAVPEDAGNYSCYASSALGWDEQVITLEFTEPPVILALTPSLKALAGEDVTLECWVFGVPPPYIAWYKGEQAVATFPPGTQRAVLRLQAVREEDAGQYGCEGLSEAGVAFDSTELDVGSAPHFPEPLGDVVVEVGEPVRLLCRAEGSPAPRVSWSRQDGKPVTGWHEPRGASSQLEAAELLMDSASLDDQAIYICKTQNEFGKIQAEIKLTVTGHAPEIALASPMVRVLLGQPVSLPCVILAGRPFPARHWLKDGQPVAPSGHYSIRADGSLHIDQASQGDAGRYTCEVTNALGSHRQDVSLVIHVPPSIELGPVLITATEGAATTLQCNATGVPPPTVTWTKVGDRARLSPARQAVSHPWVQGNVGVCGMGRTAMRSVGHLKSVFPFHPAKPRISMNGSQASDPISILAVLGQEITLPCEVQGYPPPLVVWTRESQPLPLATTSYNVLPSGSLHLAEPQVMDAGLYTCTATNAAGNASLSYSLHVQVPPNIKPSTVDLIILENSTVSLECLASGLPAPDITWYKEHEQLSEGPGMKVSRDGKHLEIQHAQLSDTGSYHCVASNVAGVTELWYRLQVTVPPSFSSLEPTTVSMLEGQSLRLACECYGIPFPTLSWWKDVTWVKDGKRVAGGDGLLLTEQGKRLRIRKAEVAHAGRYTCLAANTVGQEQREFDVAVHVPPEFIQGSGSTTNISIPLQGSLTLTCEATGVPLPTVTWSRDGSPITPSKHTHVLSGGWLLRLTHARAQDGGHYSCLASNVAGEARRHFYVEVLASPTFAGDAHSAAAEKVTVTINNPISLVCEALEYPSPNITWLKDEVPIRPSRNILLLPGGHGLQILNAQEEDAGTYSCVADNGAGEAVKNYSVKVLGEHAVKEVKARVNSTVMLECETWAVPEPTIRWYKDKELLESDGHLQILSEGQVLQIKPASVSDSGHYTCVATNAVGEDDRDFIVHVQALEVFYREEDQDGEVTEHRQAVLNQPTALYCDTNAIPPPQLTWYKDGEPLSPGPGVLMLLGGRVLELLAVQEEDAGRYTCEAASAAGRGRLHYELEVLIPPAIQRGADDSEVVRGVLSAMVTLECQARGSPPLHVSWLKDGLPLRLSPRVTLLSDGHVLRISKAQVSDAGLYTCIASSRAGVADRSFILQIRVPPVLESPDSSEEQMVAEGSDVTFTCDATGSPAPAVTWLKDGEPLQWQSIRDPSSPRLSLTDVGPADAGVYSCLAANEVGEASKAFHLLVMEPPRVKAASQPTEISITVGTPLELTCVVTGVPVPTVTWEKDGRLLAGPWLVQVLAEGRFLQIRAVVAADGGEYSCRDANALGDTSRTVHMEVHVAPEIQPGPEEARALLNGSAVLPCRAQGWPVPRVTWRKDGRLLPLRRSSRLQLLPGGSLQINPIQIQDSGYYLCMASSPAGSDWRGLDLQILVPPTITPGPSNLTLLAQQPATLGCDAWGSPEPHIRWEKDGHPLNPHLPPGAYSLQSSGSLLITSPGPRDEGWFECIATNAAGEARKIFSVSVHVPPTIADDLTDVVVTRLSPAVLTCYTSGVPPPAVSWSKEGA
ncbi:HMCN2 protein, partial [Amazona guildingii]|nr:HMCN2 protein [Amazona guildingii]